MSNNLARNIDISARKKPIKHYVIRRYVKWNNIFLILSILTIIVATVIVIKNGMLENDVRTAEEQQIESDKIAAIYARKEADARFAAWQKQQESEKESDAVSNETLQEVPEEVSQPEVIPGTSKPTISDAEQDLLVLAVQHEVGINPEYFPGQDFDQIQQAMASVIWNRVGKPGFADTLEGVLLQEGQFTGLLDDIKNIDSLPNAEQFDVTDYRTRYNVLASLNNELPRGNEILFERCSTYESSISEAWANMQSCYMQDVELLYSFHTSDGRWIMFAGLAS